MEANTLSKPENKGLSVSLVERFRVLMMTNDFRSVGSVLSDDFVLEWPQSNERIRGRDNFAVMNEEYPANGRWEFTVHRVVANDDEAVTDVSVTDGVVQARVVSFFTIENGKISRMVEFWPDRFEAPQNRTHLVERID
jgi:ketosteroid isomerase-like protein